MNIKTIKKKIKTISHEKASRNSLRTFTNCLSEYITHFYLKTLRSRLFKWETVKWMALAPRGVILGCYVCFVYIRYYEWPREVASNLTLFSHNISLSTRYYCRPCQVFDTIFIYDSQHDYYFHGTNFCNKSRIGQLLSGHPLFWRIFRMKSSVFKKMNL